MFYFIEADPRILLISRRDYDLFGPNNQNLPIILAVLEEVSFLYHWKYKNVNKKMWKNHFSYQVTYSLISWIYTAPLLYNRFFHYFKTRKIVVIIL